MGTDKIERLVNLMGLLIDARRPLPVSEIRSTIPAYARAPSDEAFRRMFERDKEDLRELGFDLEPEDAGWGDPGYRIPRQELLPDLDLTPDELAALSLALQAWEGEGGAGPLALLKLSATSGAAEPAPPWIVPRVAMDRMATSLLGAVTRRKRVRFRHRTGGGGEAQVRTLDPYRLVFRGGWYVIGFDHDREDVRSFKLSRIEGRIEVSSGKRPDFDAPGDTDLDVYRGPWDAAGDVEATVAFGPEVAWWIERRTGARRLTERDDGWVEVALPMAEVGAFAAWLAGFGDRAVALDPPELRDAVVAHLRGILEAVRQ